MGKQQNSIFRRLGRAAAAIAAIGLAGPVLAQADLSATLTAPSNYTPGSATAATYTLVVQNGGDAADTPTTTTSFPAGVTLSWTCAATGTGSSCAQASGSGELNRSADVVGARVAPNNGRLTYTISALYASSLNSSPLAVTATVDPSAAGAIALAANPTREPSSDLSVLKTASASSYRAGDTLNYTVVVANAGPSDSFGATLVDAAPVGVSFGTRSCVAAGGAVCPANASGNLNLSVDLPRNGSLSFTIPATVAAGTQTNPLTNSATVTAPSGSDPVTTNNTDSVDLELVRANLGVVFDPASPAASPTAFYTPGTQNNDITLRVSNAGPFASTGSTLTVNLPAQVSSGELSCVLPAVCTAASGGAGAALTVNLGAIANGATATLRLRVGYASSATAASIDIGASLSGIEPDLTPANNSSSWRASLLRQTRIGLSKTVDGPTTINPGNPVTYRITVENLGPSDNGNVVGDLGILLSDSLPAVLGRNTALCPNVAGSTVPCWRYCPDDGGTVHGAGNPLTADNCPSELVTGNGSFSGQPLKLVAGSRSVVEVFATVSPTASGSVSNQAQARLSASAAAVPDQAPGNCTPGAPNTVCSQVAVTVQVSSDLEVLVNDSATTATPGEDHTYTVVVRNNGTLAAIGANLQTALPLLAADGDAGFTSGSVSWQCRAFDGACCNSNSSVCGIDAATPPVSGSSLNRNVDLPAASRVEFSLRGRIDPRALGTLTVNAQVSPPSGLEESNPANNAASDTNTLLVPRAELSLSKVLESVTAEGPGGIGAPFRLVYRLQAANAGPSVARAAVLTDALTDPRLERDQARWTCSVVANPLGTTACTSSGLQSGAVSETLRLDPGAAARIDLNVPTTENATGLVTNTAEIIASAGSAQTSLTSGLSGEVALRMQLDGAAEAVPGLPIDYTLTVSNAGPDDAFGARVEDRFPSALENISWSCSAETPIPGELSFTDVAGLQNTPASALVMSPGGEHVYVALPGSNALQVISRNAVAGQGFGSLTIVETETEGTNDPTDSGASVAGLLNPIDLALSPDGNTLYALAYRSSGTPVAAIVSFSRVSNPADPAFGRLSYAGTLSTGLPATPRRLVASNTHVYVAGSNPAAVISIYRRDAVSGQPIHDGLHSDSVPEEVTALVLDRGRNRLFAAAGSSNQIVQFAINTDAGNGPLGRLARLGAVFNPLASDNTPLAGIGDLLLAGSRPGLYFSAGTPARLALATFADSGFAAQVTTWDRSQTDAPAGAANPLAGPGRLALAPDGEHLFLASQAADSLVRFRRNTFNDSLSEGRALYASAGNLGLNAPVGVAVSADGRHVLVASAATTGRPLAAYARRAPDPLFAFLEQDRNGSAGVSGQLSPADVALSPDGRHLYSASLQDASLAVFERFGRRGVGGDSSGDHLEFRARYQQGQGGVDGLDRPSRVLVSPDGRSVFVSSEDRNTLAVFDRDADENSPGFGQLSFVTRFIDSAASDGLLGAQGMAMDPLGRHLYVAGSFEAAIAIFSRDANTRALTYIGQVRNGSNGITGLGGIRDLLVTSDGSQLLGASSIANAVVVFNRSTSLAPAEAGRLSFVQSQPLQTGARVMALAMFQAPPSDPDQGELPVGGEHVYAVGQNTSTLFVLRRNTDVSSAAFGRLSPAFQYSSATPGLARLSGPRDVAVSADGRRVYVAAQFGHSVLVFDRDLNRSSATYGGLSLLQSSTDGLEGVDGLNDLYALTVSADSRNVYVAGFGDSAVASFAIGAGSSCSAGGSGDIDDRVNLGVGGTLVYRVNATVRPGATGVLENTATVSTPPRFSEADGSDNSATRTMNLTPRGDLAVSKTNDRVSVVGGETVSYEVVVRNAGPSHLRNTPQSVLQVTDQLTAANGFVQGSVSWTCTASSSGALDFVDVYANAEDGSPGLAGVSGLVLVSDRDGSGPLPAYLAAASVLDSRLLLFRRNAVDGRLSLAASVAQGQGGITALAGARSVAASSDGQFLYLASRESDSLSVFEITHSGTTPSLTLRQTVQGQIGLDQALHVVLSPNEQQVYVAGANDSAIAVFSRNAVTGLVSYVESVQNGVADAGGSTVAGLADVEFLLASPDGAQLYALSGASGSVVQFDRDAADGRLSFRSARGAAEFGVPTNGLSGASISADGLHVYATVSGADRLLVLSRNTVSGGGSFGQLSLATSLQQGVAGVQGLLSPRRVALSADGLHAYVSAQSGSTIAWFIRDPGNGSLRYLGLRSNDSGGVDGLSGATAVVVDSAAGQVYVAGSLQGAIAQFRREADSVCPPSGSGDLVDVPINVAAGGSVSFVIQATLRSDLAVGASVRNSVAVTAAQDTTPDNNSAEDVDVVAVVADLSIHKDDGLAEFDGLAGATALSGDADRVFVAGPADNAIGVFRRIRAPGQPQDGNLSFARVLRNGVGPTSGLGGVAEVLASSDGAHVYAASPIENTVVVLRRVATAAELEFVESEQNGVLGVTGLAGVQALALSADGRHLYAAGSFANAIAVFSRENNPAAADYGRLQYQGLVQNGVGGVDGIGGVNALAVSPDGRHVYALGAASSTIAVFSRNPNPGSAGFGQLAFLQRYINGQGGIAGLGGVSGLAISADGARVFVAAGTSGGLAAFGRDSSSGALSLIGTAREGVAGVQGLLGARRARLAADGQHLYVVSGSGRSVAHFRISDAALAPQFAGIVRAGDPAPQTGGQVLGLAGAADVMVAPSGRHVYAVASQDSAISAFDRSQADAPGDSTGSLDYRQSLFDGLGGIAPGEQVAYVITVRNQGPSQVSRARVVDSFPPEFSSVSWICNPGDGASCPLLGQGNIDVEVSLPVNGQVVFTATGTVGESATGRLINTATVAGIGAVDPNEANNSSTDDNTVLSPAMDLVVDVDDGSPTALPGGRVDYLASIRNLGPSYAASARVSDTRPAALYDRSWSCEPFPKAGALDLLQASAGRLDRYTGFVPAGFGRHAYASGEIAGVGAIALFVRDPLTGRLSTPDLPGDISPVWRNGEGGVRGIQGAADLVLSSDQRFVYVAGRGSDSIAVFTRDASTGGLSFLAQYQDGELGIDGLGGVSRLQISPNGQHLYAAGNLEDAIAVFSVNASSGLLSLSSVLRQGVGGVDGLNDIRDLAFGADAGYLLVASAANQSLAAFARNPNSGALSPYALVQDFELAERLLIDPRALSVDGKRVLVAGGESNTVAIFQFDPAVATAPLQLRTAIREGAGGVSGLDTPDAVLFESDQQRLYVGARGRLFLFSLQAQTPLLIDSYASQPPLGAGLRLAASSDRKQLYSADDASGGIGVWLRARGSRCPLGAAGPIDEQVVDIAPGGEVVFSVSAAIHANALGTLDYSVQVQTRDPSEELNPADNIDTDSDTLQPEPDLSSTKTDGLSEVVAGLPLSYSIELANAGVSDALQARLLDPLPIFPAVNAGLVTGEGVWSCSANAPLAELSRFELGDIAQLAGIGASLRSPDGQRLYAVNAALNALLVFPLNAQGQPGAPEVISDGSSLGGSTVQGLAGASKLAISADGRDIYVTGASANSLVLLRFDAGSGSHSFVQRLQSGTDGVAGLLGAADVVVSADGRFVFVAGASAHAIAVFSRSASTGELAFIERVADGLGTMVPDSNVIRGVRRLALAADGSRLYAVATLSQAVSSFDIAADGRLSFRARLRSDQAGMATLAGARALALSPGDAELYVLGSQAISRLRPQADGSFSSDGSIANIAELATARDLRLDAMGSRLYLADSAGALFVFARDWADGSLDLRFRLPPANVATGTPEVELSPLDNAGMLYQSIGAGSLRQLGQRALSRCLGAQTAPDLIDTRLDMGVGGSAAFDYAVRVHPSARGVLTNIATVSPGSGIDPDLSNNDGIDTTQIRAVSDLSVSKAGPVEAVAGLRLDYVIEVGNAGPSDALGMQVIDSLPAALAGATWTCTASAGSSCPASGSGSLAMTATLLVGGSLRIEIDAPINPGFVGPLTNAVSLVLEPDATDPDPDNNTDSVITEVIAIADVAVTKSNGVSEVVAGERTVYAVQVSNSGPSNAPQVRVRDLLGANLRDALWLCAAQGGASCPAGGTGGIDSLVDLPVGGSVEFLLDVQVAPSTLGSVSNTASAEVLGAPTDPQPGNNSATDTDSVRVVHDLEVSLFDPLDPFDPAGSVALPYVVLVENSGPSDALGVSLSLQFSAAVAQQIGLPCVPAGANALSCDLGVMPAGSSRSLDLAMVNLPAAPATFSVTAVVGGGGGSDPQLPNNTAVENTTLVSGIELRVSVDNAVSSIVPGDGTVYTVLVENIGSATAAQVQVSAPLAAGLIEASWTCIGSGGASCAPSGSGGISETVSLARGQSVRYRLSARLDPAIDPALQATVSQGVSAQPQGAADINPLNNVAEDEDLIVFLVFRDGFEGSGLFGNGNPGAAPPSSATRFELADACQGVRVDAASPLLSGVMSDSRQRVLLRSVDARGGVLGQLELLQSSQGRWLRLRAGTATSAWRLWAGRYAELRLTDGVLELRAGPQALAQLPVGTGLQRWQASDGIDAHSIHFCGGALGTAGVSP